MEARYVEKREGGYWITGTRVSLDSVVYGFLQGHSAETIAQSLPVLRLVEVYGAIAYYLANQAEIDQYLQQQQADFETLRNDSRQSDPAFYIKFTQAKAPQSIEAS